ncbi:unnamed protein product [Adineta ricciae]|uniref:Uncharacterized protein n=1 Tax=Adineta ricciae TaxID=249248 RepID=A0A814P9I1_ADIRI|nr:unnamed protein product [Adineta ricciae]
MEILRTNHPPVQYATSHCHKCGRRRRRRRAKNGQHYHLPLYPEVNGRTAIDPLIDQLLAYQEPHFPHVDRFHCLSQPQYQRSNVSLQNVIGGANNRSNIETHTKSSISSNDIESHIPTNYSTYATGVTIDVRKCRQVPTNKNVPAGDTCQEVLSSSNTPTYQSTFLSWPYNDNYNPIYSESALNLSKETELFSTKNSSSNNLAVSVRQLTKTQDLSSNSHTISDPSTISAIDKYDNHSKTYNHTLENLKEILTKIQNDLLQMPTLSVHKPAEKSSLTKISSDSLICETSISTVSSTVSLLNKNLSSISSSKSIINVDNDTSQIELDSLDSNRCTINRKLLNPAQNMNTNQQANDDEIDSQISFDYTPSRSSSVTLFFIHKDFFTI